MAEDDDRKPATNAELIEELRELRREAARLRRSQEDAKFGGMLSGSLFDRFDHPTRPVASEQPQPPVKASRLRDVTTARQVLMAYFMLKALVWNARAT